jgi:hypothetical protein
MLMAETDPVPVDPTCPSCAYSLRGLPSVVNCPECGVPVERTRGMLEERARWARPTATVSIVLCAGAVLTAAWVAYDAQVRGELYRKVYRDFKLKIPESTRWALHPALPWAAAAAGVLLFVKELLIGNVRARLVVNGVGLAVLFLLGGLFNSGVIGAILELMRGVV